MLTGARNKRVKLCAMAAVGLLLQGCVSSSIDQTLDVSEQSLSPIQQETANAAQNQQQNGADISNSSANAYAPLDQEPPKTTAFGENLDDGRPRSSSAEVSAAMQELKSKSQALSQAVPETEPAAAANEADAIRQNVNNQADQILQEIEGSGKAVQ